jgi:hypothetical protein
MTEKLNGVRIRVTLWFTREFPVVAHQSSDPAPARAKIARFSPPLPSGRLTTPIPYKLRGKI